jgi:mono/diheme cytochrome c family protein
MRARLVVPLVLGLAALHASCMDPVHSRAVDDLGPEEGGIKPGPRHRAGQPCVVCHGNAGPGSPEFSLAGTVYAVQGQPEPAQGVTVKMTDSKNRTVTKVTNDVGNFYVNFAEFAPSYPVFVEIAQNGQTVKMTSRIGGKGSCAECHLGKGDPGHMPAVYFKKATP